MVSISMGGRNREVMYNVGISHGPFHASTYSATSHIKEKEANDPKISDR